MISVLFELVFESIEMDGTNSGLNEWGLSIFRQQFNSNYHAKSSYITAVFCEKELLKLLTAVCYTLLIALHNGT